MTKKDSFRVIFKYEAKIPNPNNKYSYLEYGVRLFDKDNFVSVKKGKIKRWEKLKEVPDDFFINEKFPGYPNGGYTFVTTNIGYILNKCSYFKQIPKKQVSGARAWQKIKLHYVKGNIYIRKWESPLSYLSSEMEHVITVSRMLYDNWEKI